MNKLRRRFVPIAELHDCLFLLSAGPRSGIDSHQASKQDVMVYGLWERGFTGRDEMHIFSTFILKWM